MTLNQIIDTGKGRAGSNGAWRMETSGFVRRLYHYSTLMLEWRIVRKPDGYLGPHMLQASTGRGSVSDQNGMNTAFRTLGLPYRFDRDARGGGPRISELKTNPCGLVSDPAYSCDCYVCGITR